MSEPENKTAESSELAELRAQCLDLSRLTSLLLVGLIVASFTLAAFLGVQSRRAAREIEQMQQVLAATRQERASIDAFLDRLLEYGRTHPDFMPILAKYGVKPKPAAPSTTPPPAAPKK